MEIAVHETRRKESILDLPTHGMACSIKFECWSQTISFRLLPTQTQGKKFKSKKKRHEGGKYSIRNSYFVLLSFKKMSVP